MDKQYGYTPKTTGAIGDHVRPLNNTVQLPSFLVATPTFATAADPINSNVQSGKIKGAFVLTEAGLYIAGGKSVTSPWYLKGSPTTPSGTLPKTTGKIGDYRRVIKNVTACNQDFPLVAEADLADINSNANTVSGHKLLGSVVIGEPSMNVFIATGCEPDAPWISGATVIHPEGELSHITQSPITGDSRRPILKSEVKAAYCIPVVTGLSDINSDINNYLVSGKKKGSLCISEDQLFMAKGAEKEAEWMALTATANITPAAPVAVYKTRKRTKKVTV